MAETGQPDRLFVGARCHVNRIHLSKDTEGMIISEIHSLNTSLYEHRLYDSTKIHSFELLSIQTDGIITQTYFHFVRLSMETDGIITQIFVYWVHLSMETDGIITQTYVHCVRLSM